ncbi:P-II family nitrogen regulator [Caproiciproducens galactitolivorans]|uniref:Nitrogen regulatory protein P-II n=1 Tax=Caproiciproducens galactitolivorans TaxID=642589 RepID=A0A4Z0Y071_9FIRM|nr:P-II family nitrogen regulator [Caproiciproducens galactitolivorans]QEY35544.1 P-II family nitrogen regulator [Caproiciproducens galactitolivorans]TGJ77269.1 nitrogen regulatory protein P-II [Caproiciproducens galactitolivorans]
MKKVEAFIRPEKLEDIKDVLNALKLNGLSVSQIMGCGKQKGWNEYVRGSEVDINFIQKIKIELIIQDDQLEEVVDKITENAQTGDVGDGKIFISDVADAVRIRTGERGIAALK